jgi:hypothetical protein
MPTYGMRPPSSENGFASDATSASAPGDVAAGGHDSIGGGACPYSYSSSAQIDGNCEIQTPHNGCERVPTAITPVQSISGDEGVRGAERLRESREMG